MTYTLMLAAGKVARSGKDEEILMKNTKVTTEGKQIIFNFTMPRQEATEMIKKQLHGNITYKKFRRDSFGFYLTCKRHGLTTSLFSSQCPRGSGTPCKGTCDRSAREPPRRCLFAVDAGSLRVPSQCVVPALARHGPSCASLSRAWLGGCVPRWCDDEASRATRHGRTRAQSVDTPSDAARRAQASRERTRALCMGAHSNLGLAAVDLRRRATVLFLR